MPNDKQVMMVFNVEMKDGKVRETKNTIRFEEDDDEPIIKKLYMPKELLESWGSPKAVRVTIEAM